MGSMLSVPAERSLAHSPVVLATGRSGSLRVMVPAGIRQLPEQFGRQVLRVVADLFLDRG